MAASHSKSLLSAQAETPAIQVTQATPCLSNSPVFQHRAPITLRKYLQAIPLQSNTSRSGSSTGSLVSISPVPSVPSCDRCCLAQLEDNATCRACERQWLACKIWYRANDGGRRQWLTEPFIRPAESNADVRAVMESLGGPCPEDEDPVTMTGLGYESRTLDKKAPSFQGIDPLPGISGVRYGCATCSGRVAFVSGSALWRHPRSTLTEGTRKTQCTLRTWLAGSRDHLASRFVRCQISLPRCRSGGPLATDTPLPPTPYDTFATLRWTARFAPRFSVSSTSYGSRSSGLARIATGSRFVEHLG